MTVYHESCDMRQLAADRAGSLVHTRLRLTHLLRYLESR